MYKYVKNLWNVWKVRILQSKEDKKWEEYQNEVIETYVLFTAKAVQEEPAELVTARMYMTLLEAGVVVGAKIHIVYAAGYTPLYVLLHKRKDERLLQQILKRYNAKSWYQDKAVAAYLEAKSSAE